jgi:hypothetical protein
VLEADAAHAAGEVGEALDGDGTGNGVLAVEVAVEDGLAVLDDSGEAPGGDGVFVAVRRRRGGPAGFSGD